MKSCRTRDFPPRNYLFYPRNDGRNRNTSDVPLKYYHRKSDRGAALCRFWIILECLVRRRWRQAAVQEHKASLTLPISISFLSNTGFPLKRLATRYFALLIICPIRVTSTFDACTRNSCIPSRFFANNSSNIEYSFLFFF